MSKPTQTQLIAGDVMEGQILSVWLIRPAAGQPEQCSIVWPDRPTVVSVRRLPATIAETCRLLTSASLELARLKAGEEETGHDSDAE